MYIIEMLIAVSSLNHLGGWVLPYEFLAKADSSICLDDKYNEADKFKLHAEDFDLLTFQRGILNHFLWVPRALTFCSISFC